MILFLSSYIKSTLCVCTTQEYLLLLNKTAIVYNNNKHISSRRVVSRKWHVPICIPKYIAIKNHLFLPNNTADTDSINKSGSGMHGMMRMNMLQFTILSRMQWNQV